MSEETQNKDDDRAQVRAIRQARRYLRANQGTLARVLNAYHSAMENGHARGYLPER